MKIYDDLPDLPVDQAIRFIILPLLDELDATRLRLKNRRDTEALHDFRVTLRRLRSHLRAYRPYLKDSVSKAIRKKLRHIAAATRDSRDTKVRLAWLRLQKSSLSAQQCTGLNWLTERLTE